MIWSVPDLVFGPMVRLRAEMPLLSVSVSVTSAMMTSMRTWARTMSILSTRSRIRRMSSTVPETTTALLRSSARMVTRPLKFVVPSPKVTMAGEAGVGVATPGVPGAAVGAGG